MSSSQSKGGERMIHQDYIARIRYSNALPPPPNPPKLLDIPNTGLASGQYTAPGFASRLSREQPLNIEADAELGMPLDLVGMPGVFDGDESSIQAPTQTPLIHPHDRLLLRPLSTLGKPKIGEASVSFLRRTEYISGSTVQIKSSSTSTVFLNKSSSGGNASNAALKRPEKRKAQSSPEPDKGSPAWIRRRIEKSFEVAAAHLADRSKVRHPSKRNVKCVDAFPLLPDLEAFPDSGAYVTVKFSTNPVASNDVYDTRLLSGIFKPIERSAAEEQAFDAAMAAHERDPAHNPRPSNMMNYDFFLADAQETAEKFRTKFDVDHPQRDSSSLYTSRTPEGSGFFKFPRIRAYETAQEKEMDHDSKYDDEIILAYRAQDETETLGRTDDSAQRAVYYYPVMQRTTIRSQRTKNIARTIGIADEDETHLDELHVKVDEPGDDLKAELQRYKNQPVGFLPDEDEEEEDEDEYTQKSTRKQRRQESPVRDGNGNGRAGDSDVEEVDAEGDEEE
ncbi:RNA polymerase II-associated protein 1 [Diplogelasinospora grovesii]|uniref:RNA polymerase II-associated protein 1 n=1 Tax=Diplogelasinospora grovesii TaxID=303347 RepID=A0AAN6S615_9PEZI|nr:RNA polymerase II-associated protein 1 [Diplogelasinospora grovesii]